MEPLRHHEKSIPDGAPPTFVPYGQIALAALAFSADTCSVLRAMRFQGPRRANNHEWYKLERGEP